jgi:hypothetical protein
MDGAVLLVYTRQELLSTWKPSQWCGPIDGPSVCMVLVTTSHKVGAMDGGCVRHFRCTLDG